MYILKCSDLARLGVHNCFYGSQYFLLNLSTNIVAKRRPVRNGILIYTFTFPAYLKALA